MHRPRPRTIMLLVLLLCLISSAGGMFWIRHPAADAVIARDEDMGTTGTRITWTPSAGAYVSITRRRVLPITLSLNGAVPAVEDQMVFNVGRYFDPWGQIGDCYHITYAGAAVPQFVGCRLP